MKHVVVIGTGGHAKVVANIIELSGDSVVGFLTNDATSTSFLGKPILGSDTDYEKYTDFYFIIAIGNPLIREKFATVMKGVKWYTAIHPTAVFPKENFSVGEGSVISANAVVNPYSTVGKHCIINTHAVVEHDNTIADFAHISVGAHLGGNVKIGVRTWIGIGACVNNNTYICDDCLIGAGAVVIKDITEKGTYVGVPAHNIHNEHRNRS